MKLLGKYENGNYNVLIYEDGTKIRFNNLDNLTPSFAESYDISVTEKCDGGCEFCFEENTLITTPEGMITIKDLHIDDIVISYSETLNTQQENRIINISKRMYKGKMLKLLFNNGVVIICTPNHKIFTKNRGYVQAQHLTSQDELIWEDN